MVGVDVLGLCRVGLNGGVLRGSGDITGCNVFKSKIVDDTLVVDEAMLGLAEDEMQIVIDCMPNHTVVQLKVEEIAPPIKITKPSTIASGLKSTRLKCQEEGEKDIPFQIR